MVATRRLNDLAESVAARSEQIPQPAVAAVSGGADSAVAAWLVARAGGRRAIHVDHGLAASSRLRAAAVATCSVLGLDLDVVEVTPIGRSEGALRSARYRALWERTTPEEWVVVGHTADDQAETVLMNLLRGSGLEGLAGMPVVRGRLVRPMLAVERATTRELATLLGLPWVDDPTNRDLRHLRNRIRLDLLPHIERTLAPSFSAHLVRTAAALGADRVILDRVTDRVSVERDLDGARVDVTSLLEPGVEVAMRVVRRELTRLGGGSPPDRSAVMRVMDVATGRRRAAQVRGGVTAVLEGGHLRLERSGVGVEPVELRPGTVRWGAVRLDSRLVGTPPAVPLSLWGAVIPIGPGAQWPTVRAPRPRDTIGPAGEERPVPQAVEEAGLTELAGSGWPLVEQDGRIVWIPGVFRSGSPPGEGGSYLCAIAVEDAAWGPFEP